MYAALHQPLALMAYAASNFYNRSVKTHALYKRYIVLSIKEHGITRTSQNGWFPYKLVS